MTPTHRAKAPLFTKPQFQFLATTLREGRDFVKLTRENYQELAEYFAEELAQTNLNFNRAKFLQACGLDAEWSK